MDLCDKCMSEYDRDSSLMICSEHDFLTVPGPGWTGHDAGCVNALGETSMSSLRRIQETYGDREASGCQEVMEQDASNASGGNDACTEDMS